MSGTQSTSSTNSFLVAASTSPIRITPAQLSISTAARCGQPQPHNCSHYRERHSWVVVPHSHIATRKLPGGTNLGSECIFYAQGVSPRKKRPGVFLQERNARGLLYKRSSKKETPLHLLYMFLQERNARVYLTHPNIALAMIRSCMTG